MGWQLHENLVLSLVLLGFCVTEEKNIFLSWNSGVIHVLKRTGTKDNTVNNAGAL